MSEQNLAEFQEIKRLPIQDYSPDDLKRSYKSYSGFPRVGLRYFDKKDRKDMLALHRIKLRPEVQEAIDVSNARVFDWAEERDDTTNENSLMVAVVRTPETVTETSQPPIKSRTSENFRNIGEATGYIYFVKSTYDKDESKTVKELQVEGILPVTNPDIPIWDVTYAKAKEAPSGLMSEALIEACMEMGRKYAAIYDPAINYMDDKGFKVPYAKIEQNLIQNPHNKLEEELTIAEKILSHSPYPVVMWAFVSDLIREENGRSVVLQNASSMNVAEKAGFVKIGEQSEVDEDTGLKLKDHIYLLDWEKLQEMLQKQVITKHEQDANSTQPKTNV